MAKKEAHRFETLLRKRGTKLIGNAKIEREILTRYQDSCSVLVLDTSGFTRLTQKHGIIHFLSLVVAMHDIVKPVIARHHALGYWGEADNIYATFPTARSAVQCALKIQQEVAKGNKSHEVDERLDVCIGIGSGRMLRIGTSDCFGDPMNQACKLGEDLAKPQQVLITSATHDEIAGQVSGLAFERHITRISGVTLKYFVLLPEARMSWKPAAPQHKTTL